MGFIFKWFIMIILSPAIGLVVLFDCSTDKDYSFENWKKNFHIIFPWDYNKYNTQDPVRVKELTKYKKRITDDK